MLSVTQMRHVWQLSSPWVESSIILVCELWRRCKVQFTCRSPQVPVRHEEHDNGLLGREGICQSDRLVYFTDRTFKHVCHPKVWLFTQILPVICGKGLPPANLIQTT